MVGGEKTAKELDEGKKTLTHTQTQSGVGE